MKMMLLGLVGVLAILASCLAQPLARRASEARTSPPTGCLVVETGESKRFAKTRFLIFTSCFRYDNQRMVLNAW